MPTWLIVSLATILVMLITVPVGLVWSINKYKKDCAGKMFVVRPLKNGKLEMGLFNANPDGTKVSIPKKDGRKGEKGEVLMSGDIMEVFDMEFPPPGGLVPKVLRTKVRACIVPGDSAIPYAPFREEPYMIQSQAETETLKATLATVIEKARSELGAPGGGFPIKAKYIYIGAAAFGVILVVLAILTLLQFMRIEAMAGAYGF